MAAKDPNRIVICMIKKAVRHVEALGVPIGDRGYGVRYNVEERRWEHFIDDWVTPFGAVSPLGAVLLYYQPGRPSFVGDFDPCIQEVLGVTEEWLYGFSHAVAWPLTEGELVGVMDGARGRRAGDLIRRWLDEKFAGEGEESGNLKTQRVGG